MREFSMGGRFDRRQFLKTAGVAAMTPALAGCFSGNGNSNGNNGGATPDVDDDLSGVTFTYWNAQYIQSDSADQAAKRYVNNFESETGASIDVSWEGYGNVLGPDWREAFGRGDYPHLYDSVAFFGGSFAQGGWLLPFEEYSDKLSDEITDNIEWLFPIMENQFRMFDGIMEIPYAFEVFSPFCARIDHIEQAGLDPESDYPPSDYDELIDFATTLQEEGPGQYGFQIYGAADDITDLVTQWALAEGGADGLYLNEDVTDVNVDNDVWKTQFSNFVDVFREHELSNPGTPTFLNEDGSTLLTQGEISMSAFDPQENPSMRNVAPDLVENGTIQWAPTWGGPTDNRGLMLSFSYGVTRKPEDADANEWQEQQDAAIKYVEMMLSEEAQLRMWEDFGLLPVRQDVWDQLPDYAHKGLETQFTMAEDTNFARTAHPAAAAYIYGVMPGSFQQALNGDISPEEACDNAADAMREQYF